MIDQFEKWKNREIHKDSIFITDGVIDIEAWSDSSAKILFLLKEAYSLEKKEFDLCSLVKDWSGGKIPRKGGTWPNIARWAYGIKLTLETGSTPSFPSRDKEAEALREVAIVNLKKSNGKKKSKMEDIKSYVRSDFDLLINQIDLINPKIIVCASTFGLIRTQLGDVVEKVSDRIYRHKIQGYYFVDFWHPAAIFPHQLTYHAVCSLINSSPLSKRYQRKI